MTEHEKRLKRLTIRSWRRGTKEMDLILGKFWDAEGAKLDPDTLDTYEAMLSENDQDLYTWVSGQVPAPPAFADLIARLRP
ncbi:MAG: succinate dehydrogenase assembly factor 2 [Pseudomonadota bacterium]